MRMVYVNPDQATQLTKEALLYCQNNAIDYKELLNKAKTDTDMNGLSEAQAEVKIRQHEVRR